MWKCPTNVPKTNVNQLRASTEQMFATHHSHFLLYRSQQDTVLIIDSIKHLWATKTHTHKSCEQSVSAAKQVYGCVLSSLIHNDPVPANSSCFITSVCYSIRGCRSLSLWTRPLLEVRKVGSTRKEKHTKQTPTTSSDYFPIEMFHIK